MGATRIARAAGLAFGARSASRLHDVVVSSPRHPEGRLSCPDCRPKLRGSRRCPDDAEGPVRDGRPRRCDGRPLPFRARMALVDRHGADGGRASCPIRHLGYSMSGLSTSRWTTGRCSTSVRTRRSISRRVTTSGWSATSRGSRSSGAPAVALSERRCRRAGARSLATVRLHRHHRLDHEAPGGR